MSLTLILLLIILGLVTGFYSGFIGTGGNIILIPALDFLFIYYDIAPHDSVKLIIAHSLFITVFLGISVSYKQFKIKNFYFKEVLFIGIPGMVSAFILTEFIKNSSWYDKTYFDIIFLCLLLLLAIRMLLFNPRAHSEQYDRENPSSKTLLTGLGFFTGGVTSLSGLGGGVILIPFLSDILKKQITKASSISIGVITLLSLSVSVSYLFVNESSTTPSLLPYQTGYLSIPLVIPVLLGLFFSTSFGVKAAQKAKPRTLRITFGVIILLLISKMVYSIFLA